MKQRNARAKFSIAFLLLCAYYAIGSRIGFPQTDTTGLEARDPFQSQLPEDKPLEQKGPVAPVEKPKPLPVITVESIVSGGSVPQAIIKGRVFRIGDAVEGAVILNITKDGVEMLFEKQALFSPAPSKLLKSTQGGKNVK